MGRARSEDSPVDGAAFVVVPTEGAGYLTPAALQSLQRSLDGALAAGAGLLVLVGGESGVFGLGLDPAGLLEPGARGEQFLEPLQAAAIPVLEILGGAPVPTIALLEGPALGASLTLALACDARVASDSDRVVLGYPELALGLLPLLGGTVLLTRVAGPGRALEILSGGRKIGPGPARSLGLVDDILDAGSLVGEGRDWAVVRWVGDRARHPGRWRSHPRRYPQGRTWIDLFTERTRLGRRMLLNRLRKRLSAARLPLDPIGDVYPEIEDALSLRLDEALDGSLKRAAAIARRDTADRRLRDFAARERERHEKSGSEHQQEGQSEPSG